MKRFWKYVLITALFVGTTDLIAAYVDQFVKTGKFADKMLYYMAGGALGLQTSMKGGFWIGLLGLSFHYFIAFSFTLLFFVAYPKLRLQSLNKYLLCIFGLLYGPFVACFMQFIVLPLTKLPPQSPLVIKKAIIGWMILGVVLGIPIALSASRYYDNKNLKEL